jgi:hypothetical protein
VKQDAQHKTARKKALAREYKRTPKQMGVYCIRNTSSGKCFVAASRDINARFNRHRLELKMQSDRSSPNLQTDWTEQGAEVFEFKTLDLLEPLDGPDYDPGDDLEVLEQLWLDKLAPFEPQGYNRAI